MNSITQSLILAPNYPRTIKVRHFSRRQAGNAAEIAEATSQPYLGLAVTLSTSGDVDFIAIATPKEVFLISVDANNSLALLRDKPFEDLLSGATSSTLVGFEMARLAIQIGRDLRVAVCGIDLGTLCSPNTRDPWRPGELINKKVCSSAKPYDIDSVWGGGFETDRRDVCLRAWVSACAAEGVTAELHNALKVNTSLLDSKELYCLGELVKQADLLEAAKPKEVPNEFTSHKMTKDGTLSITNARYRTRVRRSNQTTVIMTDANGREYSGQARSSTGKQTGIKFTGPKFTGTLASVRVVGRQDLTNAEKASNEVLLLFLRRQKFMRDSIFIRMLWFPSVRRPGNAQSGNLAQRPAVSIPLNDSQLEAVQAMVSELPLVIVHGPPGTGKTTTISAAASIWDKGRQNAWIVAHSNVAVKNIAEKLIKNGVDFKLIVSKEFHFEWHEHIYQLLGENLIRTDELPKKAADTQKVLGSSCIVLSTLSTLSNPALMTNGLFQLVPVERLVIDEASQIKIFDFMSVFAQFSALKKVCFFGDPNQLPPYGQETAPNLQTIFDLAHLQNSSKFLNIQYRMPVPIGDFISKHVYNGRLHSKHAVTNMTCVSFIDVAESVESKGGFSWRVILISRRYGPSSTLFEATTGTRISVLSHPMTPRERLSKKALKDEKLPWECVFNVDSFQGNEAKYVLISVVRSGGPGFLTSLNRMNVMLTRCQAGLVVVTSRSFLHGGGRHTLLGRLARHWEGSRGGDAWVEWRSVASEQVDLPGAPGRNKSSSPFGFVRPSATVSFSQPPMPSFSYPSFPYPSFSPAHSVPPAYAYTGYGWSEHFPVAPPPYQPYPTMSPFMHWYGGGGAASTNGPVLPHQNYDEVFPSLQPARSGSMSSTSPHSFLHAKPKPVVASQPRQPLRPRLTPQRPQPTQSRPQSTPSRRQPTPQRPQPTPSRPQPTPSRPQPNPPRHNPPPTRFRGRAPVERKASENQSQPLPKNHRKKKYTPKRPGHKL